MIYEIALLPVHKEHIETFRRAFAEVAPLLSRAKGYRGHLLAQGIETPQLFNLIVRWQSLEDHTPGFEEYFSEEPTVYHLEGGPFATGEYDDPNSAAGMGNAVA